MSERKLHPLVGDGAAVLQSAERAARASGEILMDYLGRLSSSQISTKRPVCIESACLMFTLTLKQSLLFTLKV